MSKNAPAQIAADRNELAVALAARVSELRAAADRKQAESDRLHGRVNSDPAFWTQPSYGNAAGRSFARSRDRERNKLMKAAAIAADAAILRDQANSMERRGVVMAGDAAAARAAKVAGTAVEVGQMVNTTHYGIRKVLKVNTKTVLVEGAFGPLKVGKEFVRVAA